MEVLGLLTGSSNYTFLARMDGEPELLAVYKPRRGEAPLWDFPSGTLCHREVAAYLVSRAAGWGFVPATVLREGPYGPGAVQRFVTHDPGVTAFDLAASHRPELMHIALFDVIANNADRKAGHVLLDPEGAVWGIDHGLCFHYEPKLRTVLWDYVGDEVPESGLVCVRNLLSCLVGDFGTELSEHLAPEEIEALAARAHAVIESGVFPAPGPGRPYPWPPI